MSTGNTIWGGSGDDILNINAVNTIAYSNDGNDTINSRASATVYGGNGDDVFNIYVGGQYYGEDDEDTFNVMSGVSNVTVNGGSGTNAINDNGIDTIKINVPGANNYAVRFNSKETKELTINGIKYTVTNNGSARDFTYSIADDGQINFSSSTFTIKGELNKSHNVKMSANSIFYGGNLADTIILAKVSTVYALGGDDNITINSGYSTVYGGDGNDTFTLNLNVSNMALYGEEGNDTLIISKGSKYSYFDLGEGDDNAIINGNNNRELVITGGVGNNTITGTASNSIFNGFDETENTSYLQLAAMTKKVIEINGKNIQLKIIQLTINH